MSNFIEDLYFGNLNPQEYITGYTNLSYEITIKDVKVIQKLFAKADI